MRGEITHIATSMEERFTMAILSWEEDGRGWKRNFLRRNNLKNDRGVSHFSAPKKLPEGKNCLVAASQISFTTVPLIK